jgi:hypothetical protein
MLDSANDTAGVLAFDEHRIVPGTSEVQVAIGKLHSAGEEPPTALNVVACTLELPDPGEPLRKVAGTLSRRMASENAACLALVTTFGESVWQANDRMATYLAANAGGVSADVVGVLERQWREDSQRVRAVARAVSALSDVVQNGWQLQLNEQDLITEQDMEQDQKG